MTFGILCTLLLLVWRGNELVQASCTNTLSVANLYNLTDSQPRALMPSLVYCLTSYQSNLHVPLIRQRALYYWQHEGVLPAISLLQQAMNQEISDPLLIIYLALAEIEEGKLQSAVDTLREVINAEELLINHGEQQLKREEWESAIKSYRVATQLAPDSSWPWQGIGRAYKGQGNISAAITAYEKALLIAQDDEEAHYEFGMLLWQSGGSREKAIVHLRAAVELTPEENWMGFRNLLDLVRMQRYVKQQQDALDTARIAVKRFSQNSYAHYELGETLRLFESPREAVRAYQQAILLNPENPLYYFVSGQAYLMLLDIPSALAYFDMAVSLPPPNKLYLYHYGHALESQKRFCDAAWQYKNALNIDPDYQLASDRLQNLQDQELLASCQKTLPEEKSYGSPQTNL